MPNHLDGIYGAVIGWDSSAFSGSIRGFILGCWHPAQKRLEFCFVAEDLRTIRLGAQSTAQHPSLIFAVLTRRHPTYPSPHHLSRALTPSYPTTPPHRRVFLKLAVAHVHNPSAALFLWIRKVLHPLL
jgi:hypothetical protein